ncbi:MAG TPA: lipopolysaccharide biosynthesis protein [Actinopolymorphaceae bacterium]|jgi:PST family polysaccharide transporter
MTTESAPPAVDSAALGTRAARGVIVTVGGQCLKIVLQVASVAVLARMLSPHDYGLLAMITAIIGVADIFRDFGLSSAAIQAKTLSFAQRNKLFWINTGIGALLAVLTFAAAPLIAALYDQPQLVAMSRVLGVCFLLNGAATQYRADLNRRLKFTRLATADVSAPLVALIVAIGAALMGAGYWALVAQQITMVVVMLLLVVVGGRWLPRRPRRGVPMDGMLRFGWNLAGSQLIGYISNNIDSLIIGTRFGPSQLGLYNRAFQLLMTPLGQLRAPTTTVALPVLSKLHDDPRRYTAYLSRGQLALGYTLIAGLGLVVGGAAPISAVFLGGQWTSVVPIMRLLAIAGIFQTLAYVGYWVYLSRGLTRDLFQYTIITSVIKAICILTGSIWAVRGVATGYAIAPAIAWPLSFWWLARRSGIPVRGLLIQAFRIIGVSALIACGAWGAAMLTSGLPPIISLAATSLGGLAVYGLLFLLVPRVRVDILSVLEVLRRAARGRRGAPAPAG